MQAALHGTTQHRAGASQREISLKRGVTQPRAELEGPACLRRGGQEEHWALRHEAMAAALAYMRAAASGDLCAVVPRAIHNPGRARHPAAPHLAEHAGAE